MDRDWIDRLNTPVTRDAAERATLYRALARPRWNGIKADLIALVDVYNAHKATRQCRDG